jgi:hypothetical protein
MEIDGVELDVPIKGQEDAVEVVLERYKLRLEPAGDDNYRLLDAATPIRFSERLVASEVRSISDVVDTVRDVAAREIAHEIRRSGRISEKSAWGRKPK